VSDVNPRGLEVLFDRFATVRFLQPDVSMSVLDESALSFVADRIDEHFECVRRLGGEAIESAPLRVRRSLYEARFDTGYSAHDGHPWETNRQYSASALAWLEGIEQWRRRTLSEARERFGSAICATILASAQSAARGRRPIDDSADSQMIHRLRSYLYRGNDRSSALMVGGELLFLEALNVALRNESSPWTPLIALWERGCAPLVGIDGAWVLYVPVYAKGQLVADPDPSAELHPHDPRKLDGRLTPQQILEHRQSKSYFDAGHRFMPGQWSQRANLKMWACTYRFGRHGFAPLPSMMLHTVDTTPEFVATNTPAIALTTHVPRLEPREFDAARFDAMIDGDDRDEALIEQATAEGLTRATPGFWGA
jgi:hypothetical protein